MPLTTTKPLTPGMPPWLVMDDESNSKVNPPIDQKSLMGLEVKKFQVGLVNFTEVPEAMWPNEPVGGRSTVAEVHELTAVAVAVESLFNCTPPVKLIAPVIGAADRDCVKANAAAAAPTNLTMFFTILMDAMMEMRQPPGFRSNDGANRC